MKTCSNCGHVDGKPYERPCGERKVGNPPSMWEAKEKEVEHIIFAKCERFEDYLKEG